MMKVNFVNGAVDYSVVVDGDFANLIQIKKEKAVAIMHRFGMTPNQLAVYLAVARVFEKTEYEGKGVFK